MTFKMYEALTGYIAVHLHSHFNLQTAVKYPEAAFLPAIHHQPLSGVYLNHSDFK